MIRTTLQSALCLLLSPLLVAQQVPDPPIDDSTANLPGQLRTFVLEKGAEIKFVTREGVSTAEAMKGQPVSLAVAADVTRQGFILIKAGTSALGRITRITKPKTRNRDGYIEVQAVSMILKDGTQIKLRKNPPGEDDCGDFGPCWAMYAVMAPLVVAFSPLITLKLLTKRPYSKNQQIGSREYVLPVRSPVWAYTASAVTTQADTSSSVSEPTSMIMH